MKQVLQLTKFFYPQVGGIESVTQNIADYFDQDEQFNTDVFCANTENRTIEDQYKSSKVIRFSRLLSLKRTSVSLSAFFILKKIINRYDLIHVHHPDPLMFLLLYLIRPSQPVIIHWHGDILKQKRTFALFRPLQEWMLDRADAVIVTSEHYLESSKHLSRYKQKCSVIHLGIPDLNPSGEISVPRGRKFIFSIGRLIHYKGFEHLINAARFIDNNIGIYIAGDGIEKDELQRIIDTYGLSDKVTLLGRVTEEEKLKYLRECSIFCLPSPNRGEAFGVVLLEAMCFAKPLVTFKVPGSGMNAVNGDKETGIVVEKIDAAELAKALQHLAGREDLIELYGAGSRDKFLQQFTYQRMGRQIAGLYEEVLSS